LNALATRREKLKKLQKVTERNYRLNEKSLKRVEKFQLFNEVAQKEIYFRLNVEKNIIEVEKEILLRDLQDIHMISLSLIENHIKIPKRFCFCNNYDESFPKIKDFASALYQHMGSEVILDFSQCQDSDTPALFMLQVVRLELLEKIKSIQAKLRYTSLLSKITIIRSRSKNVNRLLSVTGFIHDLDVKQIGQDDDSSLEPIDNIGYLKGYKPQKHYSENKKGPYTKRIVEYINECLIKHEYCFGVDGVNMFEGIVGEVLSNAEDHSIHPNWYITANFSQEDFKAGPNFMVGEINLTILNFGHSMFDGFWETKVENENMFDNVNNFVMDMLNKYPKSDFSKENIFTLALLQDQVSRLKFEDESRGTGTIKFINSFLELGDFANKERGYVPNFSIFTGNTHVSCDNSCKPFLKDGLYCLALNDDRNLKSLPDKKYLRSIINTFPGTLISVKIYLNKAHLDKKYAV
jgi:hypothetical protein